VPAHCDPDDLALMALGESAAAPDAASHLATCPHCQSELDQLRAVVAAGRSTSPDEPVESPPDRVWARIVDELQLGAAAPAAPAAPYAVVGGSSRRRPPTWRTVWGVGFAAALLGVLATVGIDALTGPADPGPVVARAALAPLPDHQGSGTAEVVGSGAGRSLDLDVRGLTRGSGYYEVWLLDKDGKKLVSLGLLRGRHGTFTLPPDVDLRRYPVVDISIEPADGNPAHSGNSVVRGQLPS
jgi:anti-sigma-K factor RskA